MVVKVYSGRILGILSFSLFCCMMGVGVISPVLPLYAVKLGASGTLLGLIFSAFSISRMGCTLFSGSLADRINRKRLMMFGLSVYTISSLAYLFVDSAWHMVAIRFFNGMGSAFVVPIAMSIGSDVAEPGEEGHFFGSLQMALFAGIGAGPLISGLLTDWIGTQAPFLVMTAMTLLALMGIALWLPRSIPSSSITEDKGEMSAYRFLLSDKILLRVYAFQFATALGRGAMLMFVPLLATEMGLSFMEIGAVLSAVSISTALCQRTSGDMADRYPKNRLVLVGGVTSAFTMFILPQLGSFPLLLAGGVAFGLGSGMGSPSAASIASIRGKGFGSGRTMGLYNIFFGLGMIAGPLVAGYLRDMNIISSPFVPIGFIVLAMTCLFLKDSEFRSLDGGACGEGLCSRNR
ncbi:MFS transporter [Dethiosulfovibrio salsuginis]|uniref:Predicted arabinose efflux permease, MFS family n=1 Tax=Dethiosulfovibrio salsuginis TaxID=561720 RepID=A0A1X7JVV3_9BACT|nr:MFS transporter [Dethiosulfovibrio salsuginis]SMG32358.1 Predicted arabinose efflux permease, MFS family [Dethiosulfovibrio salsuginis]